MRRGSSTTSQSKARSGTGNGRRSSSLEIPKDQKDVELTVDGRAVRLTNLGKLFWSEEGITKRDLLQYYADVAAAIIPHIAHRAMVMRRYPNGAFGESFFMKRAPSPRPDWIKTV